MPINSFGATAASDKNIMSYVAIANFQRLLQEQGYLYFEEIPDGFYLAFAQKFGSHPTQIQWRYISQLGIRILEINTCISKDRVEPHTEGCEYEHIPLHYQCLWCVSPATCGVGIRC